MPYTIHAEIEFFVKKIDACSNNPEKPSTAKLDEHIICEYLMSPIWAFDNIENKPSSYHAEDCWKNFCTTLRERTLRNREVGVLRQKRRMEKPKFPNLLILGHLKSHFIKLQLTK